VRVFALIMVEGIHEMNKNDCKGRDEEEKQVRNKNNQKSEP